LEKDTLSSGGSGAAGAFLSPKICSDSPYTAFVNKAFNFSVNFYKDNFSSFLRQDGILRILKSEKDIQKCKHPPKEIKSVKFLKQSEMEYLNKEIAKFGGYFFEEGALIDSKGTVSAISKNFVVKEGVFVKRIEKDGKFYKVGSFYSKGVVVCTGSDLEFEDFGYIKLKKTYGHRVDIRSEKKLPFHLHKNYSISSSKEGLLHIGATHIPNYRYSEEEAENELQKMIKTATSYIDLKDFEIEKVHFGARSCSFDFFPVVGRVIDYKKTLDTYPYIKKGSKVPSSKYIYHDNLYIHTAHGARGFVLSPYTAWMLADSIKNQTPLPANISTERIFLRFARNHTSKVSQNV